MLLMVTTPSRTDAHHLASLVERAGRDVDAHDEDHDDDDADDDDDDDDDDDVDDVDHRK